MKKTPMNVFQDGTRRLKSMMFRKTSKPVDSGEALVSTENTTKSRQQLQDEKEPCHLRNNSVPAPQIERETYQTSTSKDIDSHEIDGFVYVREDDMSDFDSHKKSKSVTTSKSSTENCESQFSSMKDAKNSGGCDKHNIVVKAIIIHKDEDKYIDEADEFREKALEAAKDLPYKVEVNTWDNVASPGENLINAFDRGLEESDIYFAFYHKLDSPDPQENLNQIALFNAVVSAKKQVFVPILQKREDRKTLMRRPTLSAIHPLCLDNKEEEMYSKLREFFNCRYEMKCEEIDSL